MTIATQVWIFQLLASHHSQLHLHAAERSSRIESPSRPDAIDADVAGDALEMDRLCGYAVHLLGKRGTQKVAVAELLGVLDPDRLAAIAYALPPERRTPLLRDPIWHRAFYGLDPEVRERVETLLADRSAYAEEVCDLIESDPAHFGISPTLVRDMRQGTKRLRRLRPLAVA